MSEPAPRRRSLGIIAPIEPPYDALEWEKKPLTERGRMVCQAWAKQGYGTPLVIYLAYLVKIGLYVAGWAYFCTWSPELGRLDEIASWWLHPIAFQKAILFSMLFEGLGLGCGSGPLTGRYLPPVGGPLYWLRLGTTKLPLYTGMPLLGGQRRTWLDLLLYGSIVAGLVRALLAPAPGAYELIPIVFLVPIMGLADRTIFLAFRAEHYWVTLVVLLFVDNWIAGAKAVQLALWFFAGFSKLNHHFPTVVCVMTSNSPFTRFTPLRRWIYRNPPEDLRPSWLASVMAHLGTALELAIPIVLIVAPEGPWLELGILLALFLHGFITSNVPMGVPLEWNVMVVYGLFALFWAHPDVTVFHLDSWPVGIFLLVVLVGLPVFGNLRPERLSFLLSMRYYAGNWPYSVWLFRGESSKKLERLTKSAGWVYDQLGRFYDRRTIVGLVGKVLAFRLMHLQGRVIPRLIPKAVERFEDYEYMDGEIIAGLALGWNFGDGHLHHEELLAAIQAQCDFEEGELRCIFVESQPMGQGTMRYRICDAKTGPMEDGAISIAEMRECQPWEAP